MTALGTTRAGKTLMGGGRALRLLIVDDEISGARILAKMLREDGFTVELAFDGAAAIAQLSRHPLPEVLLTDLRMGPVDGMAVAKYARSLSDHIPIVFITGYTELISHTIADFGPTAVVHSKPVQYRALKSTIHQLVHEATSYAAKASPKTKCDVG